MEIKAAWGERGRKEVAEVGTARLKSRPGQEPKPAQSQGGGSQTAATVPRPAWTTRQLRACELTEKGERGLLSALLSDLLKAGGPLPTPLEGGVEHGTLGCSTHLPKGLCPAPRPASAPKSYAQSKPLLHHLFNGSPNSPRTSLIYNTVDT